MPKVGPTACEEVENTTWSELISVAEDVYKHSCEVANEARGLRVELKGDMPTKDNEKEGQGSGFAGEMRRLLSLVNHELTEVQETIREMK